MKKRNIFFLPFGDKLHCVLLNSCQIGKYFVLFVLLHKNIKYEAIKHLKQKCLKKIKPNSIFHIEI